MKNFPLESCALFTLGASVFLIPFGIELNFNKQEFFVALVGLSIMGTSIHFLTKHKK